ncbi:MAG: hypothetical protein L6Q31_08315 [Fimbriimonadaceae bacterium]|uniref:Uncharacterized protein n=1 Tax=Candidatus Nitrosymbiomonas proteolyticus TaxID=2608984 RepID=A0A809RAY7_9BACT|nr:hypothetical protein [Fimbriimonadaceae bacterium]NUM39844.1 hypothetical protein [Armatimonadota bacterium]BBO24630.1 conserved hypothetical protein [Candidatus Nitrosymbiomonas proteolyticus]
MKYFLHPMAILSEAAALVGVLLGRIDLLALGVVGWVAVTAWLSIRSGPKSAALPVLSLDSVRNENRTRLLPIKRLHDDIAKVVSEHSDKPVVKVVGGEALSEARRVGEHAIRLLNLRDQVLSAVRGEEDARRRLELAEQQLAEAGGPEREAIEVAVRAHRQEIEHYEGAESALQRIDAELRLAEAALAEAKARILVSASRDGSAVEGDSDLADTIRRLKSLQQSFDEAESLTRQEIR